MSIGEFFHGSKAAELPERKSDKSLPFSAEVKNCGDNKFNPPISLREVVVN
jgi:hypothetical protein